jgi:hypothetical protein
VVGRVILTAKPSVHLARLLTSKPLEQLATCTQQAAEKRWRGSQGKAKAGEKAQFTVV